jgi:hypothetical protein
MHAEVQTPAAPTVLRTSPARLWRMVAGVLLLSTVGLTWPAVRYLRRPVPDPRAYRTFAGAARRSRCGRCVRGSRSVADGRRVAFVGPDDTGHTGSSWVLWVRSLDVSLCVMPHQSRGGPDTAAFATLQTEPGCACGSEGRGKPLKSCRVQLRSLVNCCRPRGT